MRWQEGYIELEGVSQNNLKGFDLKLPKNKLVVVTGMSGSGKSSLAFDTLFAEGQRRYVETFTPYARQFFDRMDKPKVQRIRGIPPSIAIEQRNSVKSTRSTVGTMTEIADYLKVLWPQIAELICPACDEPIRDDHPGRIWDELVRTQKDREFLLAFELSKPSQITVEEIILNLNRQGFQRFLNWDISGQCGSVERLQDNPMAISALDKLTIVQDRLKMDPANRIRFLESCGQAFHYGKGRIVLYERMKNPKKDEYRGHRAYSRNQTCGTCGFQSPPARPSLFNFNHPSGACSACNGFGRIIRIDYRLAIPDPGLSLMDGAVKPWRSGTSADCQKDMERYCRRAGIDMSIPFRALPPDHRELVIEGEPGYGKGGKQSQWPNCWYGIKGYFDWLETKSYKMHVRVLLSKYRVYIPCGACQGKRLKPEALNFLTGKKPGHRGLDISDFLSLTVSQALDEAAKWFDRYHWDSTNPVRLAAEEVHRRLFYLNQVGLGYLQLNRPTRTLSGGETERVSLTTCLGSRLVNTLFILDEPSVGLHPRDTARLIQILNDLRDQGNSVLVVEHEAMVMEAADEIIDIGPRNGSLGGNIQFQGNYQDLLKSEHSLTGQYLSGRKNFPVKAQRSKSGTESPRLRLAGACVHNLKNVCVEFPLEKLIAITGVSGSGKTTLVRRCLIPALAGTGRFSALAEGIKPDSDVDEVPETTSDDMPHPDGLAIVGFENLTDVLFVDQSILGKTPRSNPAVYTKAFEPIRKLMAQSPEAREKNLNHSAFSFNSAQGQCEKCTGAGYEKIEMQFLSDVYVKCPDCDGRRYRAHILDVALKVGEASWNIADFLDATIDDAMDFLKRIPDSRYARQAEACLSPLSAIGLGYLKLGQPINTLSGGESQRLKLVRHLNELPTTSKNQAAGEGRVLFIFDEPTTGLHFEDIRLLLELLQKLVDQRHTVILIEHNQEVIQAADWVIDLGPEAGEAGGRVVFEGEPEDLIQSSESLTGQALARHFLLSGKNAATKKRRPARKSAKS